MEPIPQNNFITVAAGIALVILGSFFLSPCSNSRCGIGIPLFFGTIMAVGAFAICYGCCCSCRECLKSMGFQFRYSYNDATPEAAVALAAQAMLKGSRQHPTSSASSTRQAEEGANLFSLGSRGAPRRGEVNLSQDTRPPPPYEILSSGPPSYDSIS